MAPATSTVRLHRVLTAPPERVYRAFLDPAAMARWLPPHGFTATVDNGSAFLDLFARFRQERIIP